MSAPNPEILPTSLVDPADLARFAVQAPRYTSYPTAIEFSPLLGPAQYLEALATADEERPEAPLSLYVHLPFCREICWFCGCHSMAGHSPDRVRRYLRALGREIVLVAAHLPRRRRVAELHFGGGSPSLLDVPAFETLWISLNASFAIDRDAAVSIEVDPRTVDDDKWRAYQRAGVRRVSMGFQDLDEGVQAAIGRNQSTEVSRRAFESARRFGFDSINVDLCYGLPGQNERTFEATVREVMSLRPDRVAIFGYAHVPWMKPLQRKIDESALPAPPLRVRLLTLARELLVGDGYRAIGIDHFARPGDELARALDAGQLHRNFQGYTTTTTDALVGFGLSAISDLGRVLAQNHRTLRDYIAAVDEGTLPTERGALRSADDLLRGHIIRRLMCNFALDIPEVERRFSILVRGHLRPRARRAGRAPGVGLPDARAARHHLVAARQRPGPKRRDGLRWLPARKPPLWTSPTGARRIAARAAALLVVGLRRAGKAGICASSA